MVDRRDNDSRFQELLADFEFESLQNDSGTIYGIWPDFRLAYLNAEWFRFSAQNGGEPKITSQWSRGRCILDAIAAPLRPFFIENYQRCLREGRPWEHLYECSSPRVYRQFQMTTFPLGDAEGLLVVNSLRREAVHRRVPCAPLDELYRNEHGIVTQCAHCRRVRRVGQETAWDWVPEWVSSEPSEASHSLCEPCFGFYYSEQRMSCDSLVESFKTYS